MLVAMARKEKAKKSSKAKRSGKAKAKTPTAPIADVVDRYELYSASVQDAAHEVAFFDKLYQEFHDTPARVLREDFCGTFAVCAEWVKSSRDRIALGVDLDPEPLAWGREHYLAQLTEEQRARVTLKQADVREVCKPQADLLAAQNFSFWIFKTRADLRHYFEQARKNLRQGGLLVLDMMGGYECFEEKHEDLRKVPWPKCTGRKGSFTYVWEQESFNPITHDARFHIHFRFKDKSELTAAFTYEWRFWMLPEVCELLEEAGFRAHHVYWEGTTADGEGDDEWKRATVAESDPSWISYVVAQK